MNPELRPRRLFIPLKGDAFRWFESGQKKFELRRIGRQFTPELVRSGRRVELRYGYSARARWGYVGEVYVGEDLHALLTRVGFERVVPPALTIREAVSIAASF